MCWFKSGLTTYWLVWLCQSCIPLSVLLSWVIQTNQLCLGLAWWLSGKEAACQCRRCRFNPWLWKIPQSKRQPAPVFLPGKSHGQRSLSGYSPWGCNTVGYHLATTQQWQNPVWVKDQEVTYFSLLGSQRPWLRMCRKVLWGQKGRGCQTIISFTNFQRPLCENPSWLKDVHAQREGP